MMADEIGAEAPKEAETDVERQPTSRVFFADEVENGGRSARRLERKQSRDSMSIRSASRRRSVEPNVALPIEYRTL
jgi:hypothetical protein